MLIKQKRTTDKHFRARVGTQLQSVYDAAEKAL